MWPLSANVWALKRTVHVGKRELCERGKAASVPSLSLLCCTNEKDNKLLFGQQPNKCVSVCLSVKHFDNK